MIFFYGPRGPRERDIPFLIIQTVSLREVEAMDETPVFKPTEADSVPDTPITEKEGQHLLGLLRSEALMPDDFELEVEK